MIRIRGGSGLGDSIYLRPIVKHFIGVGDVQVLSNFEEVFIGTGAHVSPFGRDRVDVLAHYTMGKSDPTTTQWQDICQSAGVSVPLKFEWTLRNRFLIQSLVDQACGRPIVIVHGGRDPMGRTDGFGAELLPECKAFERALAVLEDCFLVRVGKGPERYSIKADIDLNDRTSVSDLLDIGSICQGIVAQCSFCVPLAEVFDKPLLAIWAARGMQERLHRAIKSITPRKILSKKTSSFVMDNWTAEKIQEAAREFRRI